MYPQDQDDGSCIYDTTSPLLQITSLDDGDTINVIITLSAETQDNYVNDVTEVQFIFYGDRFDTICIDTLKPFECEWNTTEYCWLEGEIKAPAITDWHIYDDDGTPSTFNLVNSPLSKVYINNNANSVNVTSVEYTGEENPQFIIQWGESSDDNFTEYKILKISKRGPHVSFIENGEWVGGELMPHDWLATPDTLITITDRSITSYASGDINPTERVWFWVEVYNDYGCPSLNDNGVQGSSWYLVMDGAMSSEPLEEIMVVLEPVSVKNDSSMLILTWSDNVMGTSTYQIWEATGSHFTWGSVTQYWYPHNGGTDTTIIVPIDTTNVDGFDGVFYYRVDVFAPWDRKASSNVVSFYP